MNDECGDESTGFIQLKIRCVGIGYVGGQSSLETQQRELS